MSPILTTIHHHSLRSRPRHSGPRSGETSALRLARLAANLGNGIIQQTPRPGSSIRALLTEPLAAAIEAAREAMANAAKHSGSEQIALFAEFHGEDAAIHVRDSGKGFSDPDLRQVQARLANRVEGVGGLVEIESNRTGTEVTIKVSQA